MLGASALASWHRHCHLVRVALGCAIVRACVERRLGSSQEASNPSIERTVVQPAALAGKPAAHVER